MSAALQSAADNFLAHRFGPSPLNLRMRAASCGPWTARFHCLRPVRYYRAFGNERARPARRPRPRPLRAIDATARRPRPWPAGRMLAAWGNWVEAAGMRTEKQGRGLSGAWLGRLHRLQKSWAAFPPCGGLQAGGVWRGSRKIRNWFFFAARGSSEAAGRLALDLPHRCCAVSSPT